MIILIKLYIKEYLKYEEDVFHYIRCYFSFSIGYIALNIDFLSPTKVKYIDNDKSLNKENISKILEIEITSEADIVGQDLHDSFNNEGYTILKIKDNDLLSKINNSSNWKSSEYEETIYIKAIISTMNEYYPEISKITNYKWLYKKDYNGNNPKYIDDIDIKTISIGNIFLSIYDTDNNVLYYYHFDN